MQIGGGGGGGGWKSWHDFTLDFCVKSNAAKSSLNPIEILHVLKSFV